MPIGLPANTVAVKPYSALWSEAFEDEKEILLRAIGPYILDVQHIGSTSVPGLSAKPIIDIGIAVHDFDEAFRCVAPLERIGYTYRGELGIPRRHYFRKGEIRTHHLHMNEIESKDWRQTIAFRDYLLANPETAQEYAALKIELAKKYPNDILSYNDGKDEFINRILTIALYSKKV